jgi:hypothetical protein
MAEISSRCQSARRPSGCPRELAEAPILGAGKPIYLLARRRWPSAWKASRSAWIAKTILSQHSRPTAVATSTVTAASMTMWLTSWSR